MILPPLQCVSDLFTNPSPGRLAVFTARHQIKGKCEGVKGIWSLQWGAIRSCNKQRTFGSGFSATPALRNAFEAGRARDRGRPELTRTFIPLHPLSSLADVNKAWHNQRPCGPSPQSIKGEGSASLVEAALLNQTDKIPKSSQRIEEISRMQLTPRRI